MTLAAMNRLGDATVTDIARALGIARPTAYRMLETLATLGYVEKQPFSDFYRLTSRVEQLSDGFRQGNRLLETAKPMMYALGKRIGWSISLLTPRDADMVIRVTTNHETPLALDRYRIGLAVPIMHSTAGFCYLAHCPEAEREAVLDLASASGDKLQALAANRSKVDTVLQRVRKRGFCNLEFSTYREGNIGVPLLVEGVPMGGLVMRYIKSAMTAEKLLKDFIPQLQQLSRDIAAETLHPGSCADTDACTPTLQQDRPSPSDPAPTRDRLSVGRIVPRPADCPDAPLLRPRVAPIRRLR